MPLPPAVIADECQPAPVVLEGVREQAERITEVDRIPVGKPVEVEPSREPDRIFLREGAAWPLGSRLHHPKPILLESQAVLDGP